MRSALSLYDCNGEKYQVVDGNKRVGFIALQKFLGINGRIFTASDADVVENVLELAADQQFSVTYGHERESVHLGCQKD